MKKLLAMLLCGVLTVSMLAGCGSKETQEETAPAQEEAEEETAETTDAADTASDTTGKPLDGVHLVVG